MRASTKRGVCGLPPMLVQARLEKRVMGATMKSCGLLVLLLCMPLLAQAQSYSRTETITYSDNLSLWVLGQTASVTCAASMPVSTRCNGDDVMSQITYDPNYAQPIQTKVFGKIRQTFSYDKTSSIASGQLGTLKAAKDGRNKTTLFEDWYRGIPKIVTYTDYTAQSAEVDPSGWITSVTDETGAKTSYKPDLMGRIEKITYPIGDSPAWNATHISLEWINQPEYGIPSGHWRQTINSGNGFKVSYYDGLLRPLVVHEYDSSKKSATQRFQRTRYDTDGHVTFAAYPSSASSSTTGINWTYDALGRVVEVAQDWEGAGQLKTETVYLDGLKTKVTDPMLNATITTYRAYDQPTIDQPIAISHPEGAFTDIVRDAFGMPISITRRNASSSLKLTRSFVYDGHQQLCKRIEPETGISVLTYDAAGNLDWTASAQNTLNNVDCGDINTVPSLARVTRAYDGRNRLETLTFPDVNGSQSWFYFDDGLPNYVNTVNEDGDATVINTYIYNHRRLLTDETQSQPGLGGKSLGYTYDSNGALASITYPDSRSVSFAPNALGQPTQAGSYATGVSYNPNGAMSGFTYGNGIVHSMTPNDRQLPEQSIDSGGVLNDTYDYDLNGNILAISDAITGRGNRDMVYDRLDRLTATTSPMFQGGTAYAYDVLDNLTYVKAPGRDHYYCYEDGPNATWRLLNLRTISCNPGQGGATQVGLEYDPQGNLKKKNGQAYVFDLGNRLREAITKERYRYDAHGRRVAAISEPGAPAQGSIYSYYGQDGVLRYQRDERKGKETDYITLNGSLVAGVSDSIAPAGVGLSVPATSNTGNYTVSWTPAASATSYVLQEKDGSEGWSTIQNSSATSLEISGKTNGTYRYHAQACAGECSAWSNEGTIVVTLPPTQVPVITAPATSTGSYNVTWTASATATRYALQQRTNGGSWANAIADSPLSKSYNNQAIATYDYQVKACNVGGCTGYSAVKTVQVLLAPGGTPVVTVPATSNTGNYVVTWTAVPTADTYDLQEYAGSSWTTIQSAVATSRNITGKASGTYLYRARASNASGHGPWGNEDSIVVTVPPTQVPAITLPATNYTGSYTVSWTASANATSYVLQQSVNGGSWSNRYNGTSLNQAYDGMAAGSYSYRVQACNTGGCTIWSSTHTITVTLPPASAPTITLPSRSFTDSYTVSWNSVITATSYKLDEKVGSGSWTQIQDEASTSKALSGKSDGNYSYRVRACNAAGCSAYAATKTIKVVTAPTALATITTPASNYTGSYRVSWTKVSKATDYYLQRRISGGMHQDLIHHWTTVYHWVSRSWDASNQLPATYEYRVKACNAGGCGGWSAIKTTVVHGPPAMPASLSGYATVDTTIQPPLTTYFARWSVTDDADAYELKESIDQGLGIVVYSGPLTSSQILGRGAHIYWVRACNAAGCSAWKGPLVLKGPQG